MNLPTNHERNESTTDKYSDINMQNTITTVVEPIVSARLGKDTFFSSARTSVTNSRTASVMRLNITDSVSSSQTPTDFIPPTSVVSPSGRKRGLAGALGFEPRLSVLETDVLPLTPCPYTQCEALSAETASESLLRSAPCAQHSISPLYEAYAFGKTYRTCSVPADPDRFSCSSWTSNSVVCKAYKPCR